MIIGLKFRGVYEYFFQKNISNAIDTNYLTTFLQTVDVINFLLVFI